VTLTPLGGLSRFVRTVTSATDGTTWYSSATLYSGAPAASAALHTLQAANGTQQTVALASVPGVDEATMWQVGNELVLAYRCANLLGILAGSPATASAVAAAVAPVVATVPTWLRAAGTQIVSVTGQPVHLAAVNWYGAEEQDFVVGGLDFQSYQSILTTALSLGYNSIRLPFSNQLVEQNPVVTNHVHANPELSGLHALAILDRVIGYAGALGLRVILDNHRSEAGWSAEDNGLWYTAQYPEAAFIHDWTTLATRYAASNTVIAADLRNEPHATATWGDGNPATDWRAAAQRAGDAVLSANPHVLIVVEGVQYYSGSESAWWGSNLMGVASAPVQLQFADGSPARSQLVYSAHDYGPNNCASGCGWFNSGATYASLSQVWDQYFGYIASDPTAPYAAPVWIGEFGTCNFQQQCVTDSTPGSQGQWFSSFVRYLGERRLGWAYWSLNGTQSTGGQRTYGALEYYGLLQPDWSAPSPWVHQALQGIIQDPSPQASPAA
jgi:endoglucanase